MISDVLEQNGFNEKEALVYLAALEAGEVTVSALAAKTKLKRTTIYSIVDGLTSRGVITVQKRRGIQRIAAISPRVLIDRFRNAVTLAENALPALLDMAYASPHKPRIRFFDGMEGLKEILREFTFSTAADPGLVFTDYEQMPKELFAFIRKELVPHRRKYGRFIKLILPKNARNAQVQAEDNTHYGEHRLAKFPEASNPVELALFGDTKTGFLSFSQNELFGLIIDSEAIYKTIKNFFMLVWENAEARK